MNKSVCLSVLHGYKINCYVDDNGNPLLSQYYAEWTAYRNEFYLDSIRYLIDYFNQMKITNDDAIFLITLIKKFI